MKIKFLTLLFFIAYTSIFGQDKVAGIYTDSLGQVYIQEKLPAYFFIAPQANPNEKMLIPSETPQSNPMYFKGEGYHFIRILDSKTNEVIKYKIYADGSAPKVTLNFSNGLIMNSSIRFYAERGSRATILGKDKLSGVKSIYYALNDNHFQHVTSEIEFEQDADYHLRVFAIDNVGNISDTLLFRVITAVNSVVRMKNIYFDTGSANLRPESKRDLVEFAEALNQFPEIKLEIRAHTDSRGDVGFNQSLSELRAESVVNYLTKNNISSSRLTYKGFGESMPVNECLKGVKCTEEQLQQNRRVEFLIQPLK